MPAGEAGSLMKTTLSLWSTRSNSRAIPGAASRLATDEALSSHEWRAPDAKDERNSQAVFEPERYLTRQPGEGGNVESKKRAVGRRHFGDLDLHGSRREIVRSRCERHL